MRRREFITLLGGATAAWPVVAWAQPTKPVVGFLHTRSPSALPLVAAFRRGLADQGYVEGQSVIVEYRWAEGQYDRLPALAADLVSRRVDVLVAGGGEQSALAAQAATTTIPIVFSTGTDPVKLGLVASYNRPGGNITGINIITETLGAKRLGLLHELVPQATTIGFLSNPHFASAERQLRDVEEAALGLGVQIQNFEASTDEEIDTAFANIVLRGIRALMMAADPFLDARSAKLVALATKYAMPTVQQFRESALVGGLMSYGIDIIDMYRQLGVYAGRILKGEKPSDLPVAEPTKFELVINLKTARALKLEIPPMLLARADEVIE